MSQKGDYLLILIFSRRVGKRKQFKIENLGDCEAGLGVRLFLFTGAVVFGTAKLLGLLLIENLL